MTHLKVYFTQILTDKIEGIYRIRQNWLEYCRVKFSIKYSKWFRKYSVSSGDGVSRFPYFIVSQPDCFTWWKLMGAIIVTVYDSLTNYGLNFKYLVNSTDFHLSFPETTILGTQRNISFTHTVPSPFLHFFVISYHFFSRTSIFPLFALQVWEPS